MTFNMDIGTFVIALIGSIIAYSQLKKINKQLAISVSNQKLDSLKVVLEIETQLNSRKLELDKSTKLIMEADLKKVSDDEMNILRDYFNSINESYLNAFDRLCFCIEKEYINDKDWRVEYRQALLDVIKSNEEFFKEGSPYHNMKNLNKKWQES